MNSATPDRTGPADDRAAIWAAMLEIYDAAGAGDSERADRQIHENATLWDSDEPTLIRGLGELQKLRSKRPTTEGDGRAFTIAARDPLVDVWSDTAVLRHVYRVTSTSDDRSATIRNTSVWRRTSSGTDSRWLMVHNHEDVLAE